MKVAVRKPFTFEHKPKAVNGVFEISLQWSFAALLQLVEIVFDLFFIQLCRKASKMKCHGCNVATVVIKGSLTSAEDGNVALKTLQQICKQIRLLAFWDKESEMETLVFRPTVL